MKVLVVGSGGREHSLAYKLAASPLTTQLFCAPGNPGTQTLAKTTNVDIAATDIDRLLRFALDTKIDLTVVGPEAPLVAGIVDIFEKHALTIFGPLKAAAQLEGSKVFAKELMRECGIPTAPFKVFDDAEQAKNYTRAKGACVVKADGLAAGKGVVVAANGSESASAVQMIMGDLAFGAAGKRVVVEDVLSGEEASFLVVTDGETIVPLAAAQDHKRIHDNDRGPNTGGMGAYAPAPVIDAALREKVITKICKPLLDGLQKRSIRYRGVLYVGLMIVQGEPSVLEFNVRFGDPETQAILPKLKTDLFGLMLSAAQGRLADAALEWDERYCVSVVLAADGYPGDSRSGQGKKISGCAEAARGKDVFVFHAGTALRNDELVTSGGRVLNVVALGDTMQQARDRAYEAVGRIHFDGMHFRKDIGVKALKGN